jgi:uncharacterized membrane protein
MSKGRLESFSDGVIAVAITLLALDLHVPAAGARASLAHRLGLEWPNYAAFVISFITIGIIWINHHAMLRRLVRVDHTVLLLNLVLLMTICVLPFSTSLEAQYLRASGGEHLAAAVWAGSFLTMSLAFLATQRYVLGRPELLHPHVTPELRSWLMRRNATGLAPYALATALAAASPYATLAICGAVAVFYALPGTTADVHEQE